MEVVLLGALTVIAYLLTRWADRVLKKKLLPKVCHHDLTTYSPATDTTRCMYCGDVID
jgi:hypothetical protein